MYFRRILRTFMLIALSTVLITCSKDDGNSQDTGLPDAITSFIVEQVGNDLVFTFDIADSYDTLQLAIVTGTVDIVGASAQLRSIPNESPFQISLENLGLNSGEYTFFLRAIGDEQQALTLWSSSFNVSVSLECHPAINVNVIDNDGEIGLEWEIDSEAFNVDSFEIRYGFTGFDLEGEDYESIMVASDEFQSFDFELASNNLYDVYIRTICVDSDGESAWIGPLELIDEVCQAPTNISFVISDLGQVVLLWEYQQADFNPNEIEVRFGLENFNVETEALGNVITSYPNSSVNTEFIAQENIAYHFYIRALCDNLDDSQWLGPIDYINAVCIPPINLATTFNDTDGFGLIWDYDQTQPSPSQIEVSYGFEGYNPDNASIETFIVDFPAASYTNLTSQNDISYDYYVRSLCDGIEPSEWVGPVNNKTAAPINLETTLSDSNIFGLQWDYDQSVVLPDQVEISYGVLGYDVNSEAVNTYLVDYPTSNFSNFTFDSANVYEFYIRARRNGMGPSEWVGPVSYNYISLDYQITGINLSEDTQIVEGGGPCGVFYNLYFDHQIPYPWPDNLSIRFLVMAVGDDPNIDSPVNEIFIDPIGQDDWIPNSICCYGWLGPECLDVTSVSYDFYARFEGSPEDYPAGHIGEWTYELYTTTVFPCDCD